MLINQLRHTWCTASVAFDVTHLRVKCPGETDMQLHADYLLRLPMVAQVASGLLFALGVAVGGKRHETHV